MCVGGGEYEYFLEQTYSHYSFVLLDHCIIIKANNKI